MSLIVERYVRLGELSEAAFSVTDDDVNMLITDSKCSDNVTAVTSVLIAV